MKLIPALCHTDSTTSDYVEQMICGFGYWLLVLLLLEPGNVWRAAAGGYALRLDQEAIRISGAAILGSLSTPIVYALMRRFPLSGSRLPNNAAIQVVSFMLIAAALIVASCPLALWILVAETRPLSVAVPKQLADNWPLLFFVIATFAAILQSPRGARRLNKQGPGWLKEFAIKTRSGLKLLPIHQVEWIEAQGNYVALHTGTETHLIRDTLNRIEQNLDPNAFCRVHRSAMVAVSRVMALESAGSGDAIARLVSGMEVRVSRRYRERVADVRLRSASTDR